MKQAKTIDLENWAPALFLVLVGVGIVLRTIPYLYNYSFWGDEAWVAIEVLLRSGREILANANLNLTQPLPQIGFLIVEKFLTVLLGNRELVFRFFPWLCGVLGCVFFANLSRKVLPLRAALLATAFFVLSDRLIYYSSQLKSYSSDALFAVLIYSAYFDAYRKGMDERSVARLMGLGLLALFFSLSNGIVLLSVAIVWIFFLVKKGKPEDVNRFLKGAGSWAAFFAALFFLYYREQFQPYLNKKYLESVCLMWPSTKEGILIFGRKILDLFRDPVGLIPTGLTAAVFLWGSVSWFKRDRDLCSPFLVIIALAILLSALGQYPLLGRLLLFLLPAIYLVIAEGLNSIIGASLWRKVLGVGIFLVLLIQPLALASRSVTPVESVDIRSITFYWKDHQLPGDKLFINMESFWGYAFYAWEFQSDKIGIFGNQPGRDDAGEYVKFGSFYDSFLCKMYAPERLLRMEGEKLECLLTQLPRNKRTWVLLSQINPETEKFIIKNFDQWGKRVNVVKRHSASLYLYDTSAATYPY